MDGRRVVAAFHRARVPCAVAAPLIALAGCAPSYPPIAVTRGDAAFKARIAETYPPGSSGAALRAELVREGFQVLDDPIARRYSAIDIPPNIPCFSQTRIDWTQNRRGRIVLIQAARHSCS